MIVPNINNICWILRIDIAFDYERELSEYVIDKDMSKRIYCGKDNKLETVCRGSSKREFQIRLYDKSKERKKKGTDILNDTSSDCYWRMEFLEEPKISKRNYAVHNLSAQERLILFGKISRS